MTRSIMLCPRPSLDLFPSPSGCRVRSETLLAAAEFFAFPLRDGELLVFLRDAVPKVLDQLEALSMSKFEK